MDNGGIKGREYPPHSTEADHRPADNAGVRELVQDGAEAGLLSRGGQGRHEDDFRGGHQEHGIRD